MIELILKAMGLALALVFMIGPVFFSLIQTSLEKGYKMGILMALGVSLSDAFYILVCYYGLNQYISSYAEYTGIIGGSILILFGLYSIFKARKDLGIPSGKSIEANAFWKYPLKGFLVNAANPFTILFWLATVSAISAQYTSTTDTILFFGIVLAFIFVGDSTKVALAHRVKTLITARFIRIMNVIVGLILTGLGIRLLFISPEVLKF